MDGCWRVIRANAGWADILKSWFCYSFQNKMGTTAKERRIRDFLKCSRPSGNCQICPTITENTLCKCVCKKYQQPKISAQRPKHVIQDKSYAWQRAVCADEGSKKRWYNVCVSIRKWLSGQLMESVNLYIIAKGFLTLVYNHFGIFIIVRSLL